MQKLIDFYKKYEHFKAALFFGVGFLFDLFTLDYVDDLFGLIIQSIYFLSALVIFHFEIMNRKMVSIDKYKDEIFHFCTGALLSAYTIFFFKSSSISNSFFFLILMLLILFSNEFNFFKRQKLISKSLLITLTGFFLLITILPLLLKTISSWIFYLSIIIIISLFFTLINFYKKREVDQNLINSSLIKPHLITIGFLFFSYLIKIIPPIPLVLNYAGIFHHIEKSQGEYILYNEKPWWEFWNEGDENFIARNGDRIYLFTEIYSPANISTTIIANFQKHTNKGWIDSDSIPIKISGGRRLGFRGYSYKQNYSPGDWRVLIKTQDSREIGRHYFSVTKLNDSKKELPTYNKITK